MKRPKTNKVKASEAEKAENYAVESEESIWTPADLAFSSDTEHASSNSFSKSHSFREVCGKLPSLTSKSLHSYVRAAARRTPTK